MGVSNRLPSWESGASVRLSKPSHRSAYFAVDSTRFVAAARAGFGRAGRRKSRRRCELNTRIGRDHDRRLDQARGVTELTGAKALRSALIGEINYSVDHVNVEPGSQPTG